MSLYDRYVIREGLASRYGRLLRPGTAFCTEMILHDFVCDRTVMSLAYTDVYCIRKQDLMQLLDSGEFTHVKVCRLRAHRQAYSECLEYITSI